MRVVGEWVVGDHQGMRRQSRGQVQVLLPAVLQREQMKMSQKKKEGEASDRRGEPKGVLSQNPKENTFSREME